MYFRTLLTLLPAVNGFVRFLLRCYSWSYFPCTPTFVEGPLWERVLSPSAPVPDVPDADVPDACPFLPFLPFLPLSYRLSFPTLGCLSFPFRLSCPRCLSFPTFLSYLFPTFLLHRCLPVLSYR